MSSASPLEILHGFVKNPRNSEKKPKKLEILHPNTPENSAHILINPWKFHMHSLDDPSKFCILNPPVLRLPVLVLAFFFWNSPMHDCAPSFPPWPISESISLDNTG